MENGSNNNRLAYFAAFSMSFGCIIGWSNFISPGLTYLPRAGVIGTIVGFIVASLIALLICINYIGLARSFPEAGNSYLLVKSVFDMDHAFFSAWALLFAYLCIFWANIISISFMARFLFGGGPLYSAHYTISGFDIYPGDILFSAALLIIAALIVNRGNRPAFYVIMALVVIMLLSVVIIFCVVMAGADLSTVLTPRFATTIRRSHLLQIISVAVMAPWIFVGFEAVSQIGVVGKLRLNRVFIAAGCAIIIATAFSIMLILITNAGMAEGFRSWEDYAILSGSVRSFSEFPPYYSVRSIFGKGGVVLLFAAVFSTLLSSAIGLMMAASRTIKTMADDQLTPAVLSTVNKHGAPTPAIIFIVAISLPVFFLGMNIIGSAGNISTIAISIVYGYISLATFIKAGDRSLFRICGVLGCIVCSIILGLLLLPGSVIGEYLAVQDYRILSVWAFIGLICYRIVLHFDRDYKLGKSLITWLLMFFLLFYSTNMWTHFRMREDLNSAVNENEIEAILRTNNLIRSLVTIVAIIFLFELFSVMLKRNRETDKKIARAEERNRVRNTLLTNMSHDIRTPMNAIVGFTDLALVDRTDSEKMAGYLEKIRISGTHLLSLVNDVLEISRIENGGLELRNETVHLPEFVKNIKVLASGDAQARQINIVTDIGVLDDPYIICDRGRLNHVLLYLVTNAIKRSRDYGNVTLGIMQLEHSDSGSGLYEFFIKDNGTPLPNDIIRLFNDQDNMDLNTMSDTNGLSFGLAVTRIILHTMGGHIEIATGEKMGTQIYVTMEFDSAKPETVSEVGDRAALLYGKRALVVDDILINRQIVGAMLEIYGMEIEEAKDGEEALAAVQSSLPGHYDVVLMDIQMPKLNGFDAARAIRRLPDPINSLIPIMAMTANVFDEDKEAAFDSGMNGFIPKPVDRKYLVDALADLFAEY